MESSNVDTRDPDECDAATMRDVIATDCGEKVSPLTPRPLVEHHEPPLLNPVYYQVPLYRATYQETFPVMPAETPINVTTAICSSVDNPSTSYNSIQNQSVPLTASPLMNADFNNYSGRRRFKMDSSLAAILG